MDTLPSPSSRPPRRWIPAAAGLFVGVNAVVAGALLVAEPSGAAIGLPLSLLAHSPFVDFLVPGLVLALVVGGSALASAAAELARRRRAAARATLAAGILLGGWLLVQIAFLRTFNGLHAFLLAVAALQLAFGWHAARRPARA